MAQPPTLKEIDNFSRIICERQNNQGFIKIPRYLGKGTGPWSNYFCVNCKDLSRKLIHQTDNCSSAIFESSRFEKPPPLNYFSRKRSKRSKRKKSKKL